MARAPMPAPQPLESPATRRSAMLAKLLEEQRQPVEIRGGYGELAARLLGQGITQWGANKADRQVRDERTAQMGSQRDALLAALGGGAAPAPSALADAIAPQPAGPVPPPVTNTQIPQAAPIAPAAEVQGAPLPPQGAMPAPAPMAAPAPMPVPQPAANPLGPTPQEIALIRQAAQSGDPGQLAWAQQTWGDIQMRMADPAAGRQEVQMVNGVPHYIDPAGVAPPTPVFPEGIPEIARTRDEFNPQGTRAGTLGQRDPTGRLSIIDEPPEGFEAAGGRLQPIAGGPQDQAAGGNAITNERNLRREFDTLTADYREARSGLAKVEAAANDRSGASDVALIFGFMKTLDPGSVVREGEFATASNTAGIPDRVVQLYNRALSGERLSPDQRVEFANTARSQFATYEQSYQNRVSDFVGMAEQYGLQPSNVVGTSQSPRRRPAPQQNRPRQPAPNDDPLGLR